MSENTKAGTGAGARPSAGGLDGYFKISGIHRPSMRLRRSDDPELAATVAALFSARTEETSDDRG